MPPIENQPIKVKLKCGCETEVNPTQKEAYVECEGHGHPYVLGVEKVTNICVNVRPTTKRWRP